MCVSVSVCVCEREREREIEREREKERERERETDISHDHGYCPVERSRSNSAARPWIIQALGCAMAQQGGAETGQVISRGGGNDKSVMCVEERTH